MTRYAALAVTLLGIAFAAGAATAAEAKGRRSFTSGDVVGEDSVREADVSGAILSDSAAKAEADAPYRSAAAAAPAADQSDETNSGGVDLADDDDAVNSYAGAEEAAAAADGRPTDDIESVNAADDATAAAAGDVGSFDYERAEYPRWNAIEAERDGAPLAASAELPGRASGDVAVNGFGAPVKDPKNGSKSYTF